MKKDKVIENKIEELLGKMTLHEKVGQLHQVAPSKVGGFEISKEEAKAMFEAGKMMQDEYELIMAGKGYTVHNEELLRGEIGSFIGVMNAKTANELQRVAVEETRLGIPLIFGLDVIHGFQTIFPIPLAEACSFDDKLFEETAHIAAKEAAEGGVHWTYAPMVDIARDARWGRIAEGAGEDTYLTSRYAAAKVRGFQGEDMSADDRIAACLKHFAAYGACEGGRDYDTVDMSMAQFYETYLPPYAAAVKEGCATAMAAFNDLSGIPCTTNKFLLQDVLCEQLGFNGFVISDANAIKECVNHGTAENDEEAVKQSIEAGTAMDLGSNLYTALLEKMVEDGKVDVSYVDEAVRNILRVKFQLGLFEHPYTEEKEQTSYLCEEHRTLAREAGKRSIVLLKNENQVLPLKKEQKIAVVGAVADDGAQMLGCWSFTQSTEKGVTLLEGFANHGLDVTYAPCCGELIPLNREELQKTVKDADIVIVALEYQRSGEAESCCRLELPGDQIEMVKLLKELEKPIVSLLFNGRPIAVPEIVELSDAVVEVWNLGIEAGNSIADVLVGEYNPSGRLTTTFPNYSGECPVYYNHPNTGRPRDETMWTSKYRDAPLVPLFPFGYGLSYTEYQYSNLKLTKEGDSLVASVDVTNTGEWEGEETVQLYIHRRKARRVRPVRELKGYQKVLLAPGERKTVTIYVEKEALGYYDSAAVFSMEESIFDVWMAHDSACGEHGIISI